MDFPLLNAMRPMRCMLICMAIYRGGPGLSAGHVACMYGTDVCTASWNCRRPVKHAEGLGSRGMGEIGWFAEVGLRWGRGGWAGWMHDSIALGLHAADFAWLCGARCVCKLLLPLATVSFPSSNAGHCECFTPCHACLGWCLLACLLWAALGSLSEHDLGYSCMWTQREGGIARVCTNA